MDDGRAGTAERRSDEGMPKSDGFDLLAIATGRDLAATTGIHVHHVHEMPTDRMLHECVKPASIVLTGYSIGQ